MKSERLLGVLLCVFGLSSCMYTGPGILPPDRLSYNRSLSSSEEQQNLLNIVRLRYTDPIFVLAVNNIVAQYTNTTDVSLGITNGTVPQIVATSSAGLTHTETPTITYTPLQGTDFVTKMLTPVNLPVIYMLLRSGWSVNHILRILIERAGPYENASIASRATSSRVPIYQDFLDFGLVLHKLEHLNALKIEKDTINGQFAIKFMISHLTELNAKELAFLTGFGVTANSPVFWFVDKPIMETHEILEKMPGAVKASATDTDGKALPAKKRYVTVTAKSKVVVTTRTVLELFNYLSKGVDIPKADIANKQAPLTYNPDGTLFNWHEVTKGMIRVRSSTTLPKDAFVAVKYKNYWFYVPSDDFYTKETLSLVEIIVGIYQGDVKSALPVFTVS